MTTDKHELRYTFMDATRTGNLVLAIYPERDDCVQVNLEVLLARELKSEYVDMQQLEFLHSRLLRMAAMAKGAINKRLDDHSEGIEFDPRHDINN